VANDPWSQLEHPRRVVAQRPVRREAWPKRVLAVNQRLEGGPQDATRDRRDDLVRVGPFDPLWDDDREHAQASSPVEAQQAVDAPTDIRFDPDTRTFTADVPKTDKAGKTATLQHVARTCNML
jgi:hypothetical protein